MRRIVHFLILTLATAFSLSFAPASSSAASGPASGGTTWKYRLSETERYSDYLKAAGYSYAMRFRITHAAPDTELTLQDDVFTMKTMYGFGSTVISFRLGVSFEETMIDDRKATSVVTFEPGVGTFVQRQDWGGGKVSTITRAFYDNKMVERLHLDGVVAVLTHEKAMN